MRVASRVSATMALFRPIPWLPEQPEFQRLNVKRNAFGSEIETEVVIVLDRFLRRWKGHREAFLWFQVEDYRGAFFEHILLPDHRGPFNYHASRRPSAPISLFQSPTSAAEGAHELPPSEQDQIESVSWQMRLSDIMLTLLWDIHGPLQSLGHSVEDAYNLFQANGGLLRAPFRALFRTNKLVVRDRHSEDYASVLAALDPRSALYVEKPTPSEDKTPTMLKFPGSHYGSRITADVLVMAAKLAYENAAYVERVVKSIWKMNFIGFYNCWNEFQQLRSTQVFLFTDQEKDANAIVVAFRGTEPFSGIDWMTDFDFSWFELNDFGNVHLGFMEALGLVDRNREWTFRKLSKKAGKVREKQNKKQNPEECHISGLPDEVITDPTKFLAYDGVTKKLRDLMLEHPKAKLFITGHSLGGALANLFAGLLFHNNELSITSRLGTVYTFGQPRVGGDKYHDYFKSKLDGSQYWRVVYAGDLVPRVPADNFIFQFKHCGYCYYYDERFAERTLIEAPDNNYFSFDLGTNIWLRCGALYELVTSLFNRWNYGPEYAETYVSTLVRLLGLVSPGLAAHMPNNYVNVVRLGLPTPLEAKLSEGGRCALEPSRSFGFIGGHTIF